MNNLFKNPSFSKPNQRNGFDMSMRRLFTAPPGMLLPVYTDIVQGGDKYKLNVDAFCRTEAVDTAAFQNFRLHFDWFYIPFRQIYSFWNEFYNGTFDSNTNFVSNNDKFALPLMGMDLDARTVEEANGIYFNTDSIVYDEFGVPRISNARRLADLLGFGTLAPTPEGVDMPSRVIFPYKHLAYHKIFFSHYFRGDWTQRDTSLFNVDSYHGGKVVPREIASKIMYTLHYRPYHLDLFTNVFPSPVFNKKFASIVSDSFLSASSNGVFTNREDPSGYSVGNISNGDTNGLSPYPAVTPGINSDQNINASTLRSLFNFDKLVRITSLAGSHYTEQMRAHFGVNINNDIHDEAYFIGSQSVDISISEVVATASTGSADSGSNLGDIAGKGFGASSRNEDLQVYCPEQGLIMCLASIEPIQMYSSQPAERNSLYKGTFDFYRTELDNLGMQPVYDTDIFESGVTSTVLGFQYRYSELKTKVDIVNEGFFDYKRTWQCNYQSSLRDNPTLGDDVFKDVNHRFYINPSYANTIFLNKFPAFPAFDDSLGVYQGDNVGTPVGIYSGDNFLINANFRVLKDSIMSVHSLPKLF